MDGPVTEPSYTEKAAVVLANPEAMRVAYADYMSRVEARGEVPVNFERFELGVQICAETGALDALGDES